MSVFNSFTFPDELDKTVEKIIQQNIFFPYMPLNKQKY